MDELACSVCSQLQSNPSILPCCHKSVCLSHISERCPLCKFPINPEDIIQNWILSELANQSSAATCERCEKNESNSYCVDCKLILCSRCYSKVHKGKYSFHKTSIVSQLSFEPFICRKHEQDLEYFCTEEWKGICSECIIDHGGHLVLDINEAADQTVYEVNNKRVRLIKIKEEVKYELEELEFNKKDLMRKYNDLVESTKENFKKLHRILEMKEIETFSSIEDLKEKKLSELQVQLKDLNERFKKIENVIKMIDISKQIPASVMMESMKYLTSLIQSSFETEEGFSNTVNTSFGHPDFKSVFQYLESFSFNESESASRLDSHRSSYASPFVMHRKQAPSINSSNSATRMTSPIPFRPSTPSLATEDVLEKRNFISKQQTQSCIKLSWGHVPGTLSYVLEYGIGARANGVEQFRQVYQGASYNCLITDLIPKTSYRFRVCALDENKNLGPWSDVIQVATLDPPSMDESSYKNVASINKRNEEKWIQFERAGTIQASYPFVFGKHSWEVKVLSSSFFQNEENVGWIKIGVASGKNKNIVGYVLAYANCKSIKINLLLDVDAQMLKVKTSETADVESYSLNEGPQVPSFQYKPAKNCRNNVKILVKFDDKANF